MRDGPLWYQGEGKEKKSQMAEQRKRNKQPRSTSRTSWRRFKGIEDAKLIEAKMKEVWFDTYKLWANIARFEKNYEGTRFQSEAKREEQKTKKKDRRESVKTPKSNPESNWESRRI
ncbi:hypothetical protein A2U01_0037583 [Trifolium medium]|uniref:Uncharacterized protein n=1 Tax=Trifolium medium TaxID=97028 RepID=A0A392PWK0_9FABA|nr:hypothetical protein [Trifolium medium]